MTDQSLPMGRKRTAVLVVHGMGSQRPQDTVRGVVDAVWRGQDDHKVWFHPEPSGADIDLPVMTTNRISDTNPHSVDFHELYWAHQIAETRAMAVLLWLFEKAKKGPRLKPGMKPLWWGIAIYLVFLILSVTFLVSQIVQRLAQVEDERESMVITPLLTIFIVTVLCTLWALIYRSFRITTWAGGVAAGAGVLLLGAYWAFGHCPELIEGFATHFLPAVFSLLVAWLLMGKWAFKTFGIAIAISLVFHVLKPLVVDGNYADVVEADFIPWSLEAKWSTVAAWLFIAGYVVLSAAILQPYIGDVARYLRNSPANVAGRRDIRRNAVDTLLRLHSSGDYDRIIVLAHSLGTVVAYDMLRATFARICRDMPTDAQALGPELAQINNADSEPIPLRKTSRALMRKIYTLVEDEKRAIKAARPAGTPARDDDPKAWLVTDFITVGSPLTHAHYLLCQGKTEREQIADFDRRKEEREFPACPPLKRDGDGLLTFYDPLKKKYRFHTGALFGLTRWTNLYFPMQQVFWGDPIGGPVGMYGTGKMEGGKEIKAELFGKGVVDVAVSTESTGEARVITHTAYWDIKRPAERDAPHILALKRALDLEDRGGADDPANFKSDGVRVTSG